MRKLLAILALPALACGMMQVGQPTATPVVEFPQNNVVEPLPTESTWIITVQDLNVRETPNGTVLVGVYLHAGDIVTVTGVNVVGDTFWCKHDFGWSACRYMEIVRK